MGFDSLFTGISGLDAYQSQIDLISNNIANVGTVGFKGQDMTFADLFYQQTSAATAPNGTRGGIDPQEIGIGVKVNSTETNFAQGGFETTGVNTDLAINGDGFFVLQGLNNSTTPTYTRDGAFSLNPNGLLYDPASGLAVQGWTANGNGVVNATGVPGNITIPIGLSMQATATGGANAVKLGPANDQVFDMSFGGSLDQTQYAIAAAGGTPTNKVVTTTIYDSLGNAHQATITFAPDTATALPATVNNTNGTAVVPATRWTYTVTFADGTTTSTSTGEVFFDQNGQFINTSSSPTGTPVHAKGTAPSAADGDALVVNAWPAGNNSTAPQTIGLDFSSMAALAGTATANVTQQDGFAAGTLANFSVGSDGTVTGNFTNGQQKVLAQVALARFQNEDGLTRVGGNQFAATPNSGLAQIGTATSGSYGSIVAGTLEESNVSLADEFTKMIVAQRAFEANTRSISTGDQNLQDLINLRASEN
jgi:flagellar hook protein FlgE